MQPSNPYAICRAIRGHEGGTFPGRTGLAHAQETMKTLRHQRQDLSQHSLLAQLSEAPQSLTTLADRMEIDRTTLTRSLQPLLEQGWVAESTGTDPRQRLFIRSPSGTRARNEARKYWRQAQAALEQHLGGDFVAKPHTQLDQALSRLRSALPEDN